MLYLKQMTLNASFSSPEFKRLIENAANDLQNEVARNCLNQYPLEFDFFNEWCGKDPVGAKEYYETNR